jgi:O-antigen ligase
MQTTAPSTAKPTLPHAWDQFALVAVCLLAVSVSLGAALVSLSKVLVLIAVLGRLVLDWRGGTLRWPRQQPGTVWAVCLALGWMLVTFLWTEAARPEAITGMLRHSRFVWLLAVFYLLRTPAQALTALKWVVLGQLFVVISSWLLWLGVPLPWGNKYSHEMGVLFTSTLEQPVMSSLMLLLLWFFRDQWPARWPRAILWAAMLITLANVLFIMSGRTGFLVILLLISLVVFWEIPKRYRWSVVAVPLVLGVALMALSPRFKTKISEIHRDVTQYQEGNFNTSQGQRLDYWHRSLLALAEKPLLGHGAGSWKANYQRLGGLQQDPPSNPHQQYLLWAVEAGAVGLLLLIGIFAALYRDALRLPQAASRALISTTAIAALMSMMNCPFFGVGIGEFFLLMMGSLLALSATRHHGAAP